MSPRRTVRALAALVSLLAAGAQAEGVPLELGVQLAGILDAPSRSILLQPEVVASTRAGPVRLGLGARYALCEFRGGFLPAQELRAALSAAWEVPLGAGTVDLGAGAVGGKTLVWFQGPAMDYELHALSVLGWEALVGLSAPAGERTILRVALRAEGVWTWGNLPSWSWARLGFDARVMLVAGVSWRLH
jgi:hypothetical protein